MKPFVIFAVLLCALSSAYAEEVNVESTVALAPVNDEATARRARGIGGVGLVGGIGLVGGGLGGLGGFGGPGKPKYSFFSVINDMG